MDLTSPQLALRSLARRGASQEELVCTTQLEQVLGFAPDTTATPTETLPGLKTLLDSEKWECKAAGLCASTELIRQKKTTPEMIESISDYAETYLEHKEPRVRACVVKVLEELAKLDGPGTWNRFGVVLCDIVDNSFGLDEDERAKTHRELALQETRNDNTPIKMLVHETIGWKALETSMRGVESLVRGYGANFVSDGHLEWKDHYLISLVSHRALKHENRYVREVGYDLCAEIAQVLCESTKGERDDPVKNAQLSALSVAIKLGLTDNWSQVRFAASVAARKLMAGLTPEAREVYLADLVPRMCLNRYYLAEGVRIYSQETWKLVFRDKGVDAVKSQIGNVVEYYCEQSHADNHGVREAACHCISELSCKVEAECLSPYVDKLLGALVDCFKDESWPVRDAACVATGQFVRNFPQESKPKLDELFELFFDHLSDNIWSVREDSAVALGNVMQAYPEIGLDRVKTQLPLLLKKVQELDGFEDKVAPPLPPSSPRVMAGAESQPRGVVHGSLNELRSENRNDRHSNQQMFSCGSLAPKLKRKGVGCMDHGYSRPKRNYEITDGGIYLLRELAQIQPDVAETFMPLLADVLNAPKLAIDLQVTLWKQLVPISRALGKRPFKRYLESFLPRMISTLNSDNQLAAAAAADCISFMVQYLGKGIFRGRVENLLNGEKLWDIVQRSPLIRVPLF